MSSTIDNKNMVKEFKDGVESTGILQFNSEMRYCYILMENGREILTTPLFDFFNGFISFNELVVRMQTDQYSKVKIDWIIGQFENFRSGRISSRDFYRMCDEYFGL